MENILVCNPIGLASGCHGGTVELRSIEEGRQGSLKERKGGKLIHHKLKTYLAVMSCIMAYYMIILPCSHL